jgi:hypothetical protein
MIRLMNLFMLLFLLHEQGRVNVEITGGTKGSKEKRRQKRAAPTSDFPLYSFLFFISKLLYYVSVPSLPPG